MFFGVITMKNMIIFRLCITKTISNEMSIFDYWFRCSTMQYKMYSIIMAGDLFLEVHKGFLQTVFFL